MQSSDFAALRRRLLPLAALAAATALGGCVATAPAPGYYGYNYPAAYGYSYQAPYYGSGYTTTTSYPATTTYPSTYPLYSPYFHGNVTTQSDNGGG